MVGRQGFEPWTNGLKGRCSTAELPARKRVRTLINAPTTRKRLFCHARRFPQGLPLGGKGKGSVPEWKMVGKGSKRVGKGSVPECRNPAAAVARATETRTGMGQWYRALPLETRPLPHPHPSCRISTRTGLGTPFVPVREICVCLPQAASNAICFEGEFLSPCLRGVAAGQR